jgi:uncharacterized protein
MTAIPQNVLTGVTEKSDGAAPTPGLPPYHLFETKGERFAYFLERDCSFRIDACTYALLEHALEMPLEESADQLRTEGAYDNETIAQVLVEAKRLEQAGLFRTPRTRLSQELMEAALTHRYTTPWTRLELALAESCNLNCSYCYCTSVRDMPNEGLMSEEVARKAIDWLFKASGDAKDLGITLFGGEPLLNKPVFKFVMDYSDALAKERGKTIRYTMTTNGTLIDDMVIHYIKKHDFGLMVSLDGPPEIHDAQCPTQDGGPSFELAAAGIKRLMRRRRRVTVRCTMTKARPKMLDLVEFFEDFGFTRIVLGPARNPINPTEVDCDEACVADFAQQRKDELHPWMLTALSEGRIPTWFPYARMLSEQADPSTSKNLSMFRCGACRGTTTVGADGRLYPCHRFLGMQNFIMGHISDGPDIAYAKKFWRMYDDAVDTECSHCWARRACNRPCPWQVAQADGTFSMWSEDDCNSVRNGIEENLHMRWYIQTNHPEMYAKLSGQGVDGLDSTEQSSDDTTRTMNN